MIRTEHAPLRLPAAFRKKLGGHKEKGDLSRMLRRSKLHTVCEEAHCPNIGECFENKTATFMICGDTCTRRCHFCAVKTGRPSALNPDEPAQLAEAVEQLGLNYVVLTSVDRDELADGGAGHWFECIRAIKTRTPWVEVEVLTPDFKGVLTHVDHVVAAGPAVYNHNIETVERLYKKVRPQSNWGKTVSVIKHVASLPDLTVKSGLMVGLGETDDEVCETMTLLHEAGVDIVTIGQYLRPTMQQWPVDRYVDDASYERYRTHGGMLGFKHVFAGPFVRSSYHASESFLRTQAMSAQKQEVSGASLKVIQ